MRSKDPRNVDVTTFLAEPVLASELAPLVGTQLRGRDILITGVAAYGARAPGSLSYQSRNPSIEEEVKRAVICTPEIADSVAASTKLLTPDPRAVFMRFLARAKLDWARTVAAQAEEMGVSAGKYEVHSTALIEPYSLIGKGAVIEPLTAIMNGSIIGEDTLVSSGAIVGAHGPAIHKCLDGTVLSWARIHVGTVQVGSNCELGSQTIILRGMLGRTYIGHNTILGNMVHIGHGAYVGEHVWMAARVTICGHAYIDDRVSIGAGATIRDNTHIGPATSVGMGSVVVGSVEGGKHVLGVPAKESTVPSQTGPPD